MDLKSLIKELVVKRAVYVIENNSIKSVLINSQRQSKGWGRESSVHSIDGANHWHCEKRTCAVNNNNYKKSLLELKKQEKTP